MQSCPEPHIVHETPSFLLVYKPHGLHTAPLKPGGNDNLLAWCVALRPELLDVKGLKNIEHGLLHRLDGDTDGLVLLAKNQASFDTIIIAQKQGLFFKEYKSVCERHDPGLPGFPVPPKPLSRSGGLPINLPFVVESGFRAFGPGRQAVRPVDIHAQRAAGKECALDQGAPYRTEILEASPLVGPLSDGAPRICFHLRLLRGFRHQVRCHLAWLGYPISGDTLYGSASEGVLGLSAVAMGFPDPETGEPLRFTWESVR